MADEATRRRGRPPGAAPWRAKLKPAQVRAIRTAHDLGATKTELARKYGVGWVTIRDIVIGKTWKHLLPKEEQPQDTP